ncbi:MAG: ABC transporter ATP-binding protein [Planctomycetota bacterium]|nr:ABC transporter ATP-binding protein [Planctomycetota bacterium]
MARVTFDGLGKVYPGGVRAVAGVDLEVEDGEFVVLVGPSGCGKSTTLRMVAGLEEITEGTLSIGERVVNEVPGKDRDIAMVFQNYALYPHLTVRQNMAFPLERRRAHGGWLDRLMTGRGQEAREEDRQIQAEVTHAAEVLGITDLLDRKPGALSGGQRQRVAVGRALVRRPAAFLFDEPLSNLDAKLRVEMRAELKALHERLGATMLYVTHDQEEAMTLGDRLVVMDGGEMQQCASPREVYEAPANRFVAGFVGTPSMNFLEGTFADGTLRVGEAAVALNLDVEAPDGRAILGIRPDRLRMGEAGDPCLLGAEVIGVEDLGDRCDVRLGLAGTDLVARRPASELARWVAGSSVQVTFEPSDAHVFEPGPHGRRLS